MNKSFKRIRSEIEKAKTIVLTTHLLPDGDAIGSEFALYYYIMKKGKKVHIINHNESPDHLLFLDEDKVMELGTYLSQVPNAALYVTAPATTKSSDLQQVISTLALFKLKGVIATKMDETFSFGDLFNVLMSTHLPVHYFTSGTQIFGKLHQGEPGKLVAAIFGEGF